MRTHDLLDERTRTVAAMRSITDDATDGDLSDEQAAKFDCLKDDLAKLDKRIERQALLDDAERRMSGTPLTGSGDGAFDQQCRSFSLLKHVQAQIGIPVDDGLEREVSQELARRAYVKPTGAMIPLHALIPEQRVGLTSGDAGNLVATEHLGAQFIDALRPRSIVQLLGGRTLTGLRGDISIPKLSSLAPGAEWVSENTALTGGDHTYTALTGDPKTVGALTTYSRHTIMQADPSVEELVRSDFAAKIAAAIDLAAVDGSGSGGQPEGLLQKVGVNEVAVASPTVPTWAEILQGVELVENANALQGSLGWAMNGSVKRLFRSTLKVGGDAGAGYLMDGPGEMAGSPVQVSSQIPGDGTQSPQIDGVAIFGDWSQLITLFWGDGGVDFLVNPFDSTEFPKGGVKLRMFLEADVIVRHEQAFSKVTGLSV